MRRTVPLTLLTCAALTAPALILGQSSAAANSPGGATHAVAGGRIHIKHPEGLTRKKKKKGKHKPTATVNASWKVTREAPWNGGTEKETIEVAIKDAVLTFKNGSIIATGDVPVDVRYTAEARTTDRSLQPICDSEEHYAADHFSADARVIALPVPTRRIQGKDEMFENGWSVQLGTRLGLKVGGAHGTIDRLEGLTCKHDAVYTGLGWWSPYFTVNFAAYGKLNGGGKGVILTMPSTENGQEGSASGTIKFSKNVELPVLP